MTSLPPMLRLTRIDPVWSRLQALGPLRESLPIARSTRALTNWHITFLLMAANSAMWL